LAFVGGGLILASGVSAHGFLLSVLSLVSDRLPAILPGTISTPLSIALAILSVPIALGGLTVISGGVALYRGHIFTGRLLIALGGGASFLGLLAALAYAVLTQGAASVDAHSQYWIGVVIAILARRLAGRAP
jgi:hypothetical protein